MSKPTSQNEYYGAVLFALLRRAGGSVEISAREQPSQTYSIRFDDGSDGSIRVSLVHRPGAPSLILPAGVVQH